MKYQAIAPFLIEGPIIDVGIGTGIGLPSLIKFSPIVGVDGAVEMLRYAIEQIKEENYKQRTVSLVCAVAEALPFRDHSVPTVVSITVIQNCADIHQGTAELIRVLQKDGLCAITSLSKTLPLDELESAIKADFALISQFENLADEDDGIVFQLI
ncbi:MAG: class I SAM-dependent methyltransferase [Promethearchaeota archaeon]